MHLNDILAEYNSYTQGRTFTEDFYRRYRVTEVFRKFNMGEIVLPSYRKRNSVILLPRLNLNFSLPKIFCYRKLSFFPFFSFFLISSHFVESVTER